MWYFQNFRFLYFQVSVVLGNMEIQIYQKYRFLEFPETWKFQNFGSNKYFTFCKLTCSFTSMFTSFFPCFSVIFIFANAYEVLSDTHILYLAAIFVLSYVGPFMDSLVEGICFFSFMPITFEIVDTCVSIQNTNAYKEWSKSHKCFT